MLPELRGLPLDTALAILAEAGIKPETILSMPPRAPKDMQERTARVVRYQNNQLLYSCFKDGSPEEA